jgi:hypothetical protein
VAFPEAQHLETKPAAQRFLFWDKTHGESILKLQATVTKNLSQIFETFEINLLSLG